MTHFPEIRTINDVLPHIEGKDEFIVAERDHFDVINYVVSKPDTFSGDTSLEAQIRRECRGLLFAKDGTIMARRFHKFFNVGEKEWTQPSDVNLTRPHIVMEKIDGSMVSPLLIDGELLWTTKMGFTDVAEQVNLFTKGNETMRNATKLMGLLNITPIFEWCSRENRIVVDYGEESSLTLIGARQNFCGSYIDRNELKFIARMFDVGVVNTIPTEKSIVDLHSRVKDSENNSEGVVIQFLDTGEMLKIKSEWYLALHGIKDKVSYEHKLVEAWLSSELDDLIPLLDYEQRENVLRFVEDLDTLMMNLSKAIELTRERTVSVNRADFAREYVGKEETNKVWLSIMFQLWEEPLLPAYEIWNFVASRVGQATTKETKWENFKCEMNWKDLKL